MSSYPKIFRRLIAQSTQSTLDQLHNKGAILDAVRREHLLHTLDFALKQGDAWEEGCQILLRLEPEFRRTSMPSQWVSSLTLAVKQAAQSNQIETAATLSFSLGYLFQRLNDLKNAFSNFEVSAKLFESLDMPLEQANAMNRIAFILRLRGDLAQAEETAQLALQYLATDERREFSHFVLGMIAHDRGAYTEALAAFRQSLTLVETSEDPLLHGQRLRNFGPPHHELGQFGQAIDCYKQSIALFTSIGATHELALTKMNLGNTYSENSNFNDALIAYAEAESILLQSQERLQQAQLYTNIGIVQRKLGNNQLAEHSFRKGIKLWREFENNRSLANALDELAVLYTASGKLEEAQQTIEQAEAVRKNGTAQIVCK